MEVAIKTITTNSATDGAAATAAAAKALSDEAAILAKVSWERMGINKFEDNKKSVQLFCLNVPWNYALFGSVAIS